VKAVQEKNAISVGIPRTMLYYRYGTLWRAFFEELHIPTVISPPTTRETIEIGSSIAVDETCLSAKLFMGHVHALLGKCGAVFIPRYSSLDHDAVFCTRFEGLYDQTRNVFRASPQRFISCNIDSKKGSSEAAAFEALGKALGASARESRAAYAKAWKADQIQQKQWIKEQEALSRSDRSKILLVGHSYVLSDPYLQKPIQDYLTENGAVCLRADRMDRAKARKACAAFSPTCRWIMNEELIGSTVLWKERVDGIILVSAFPCGPDSMTSELIARRIKDVPLLNLVLDEQSGTAGVETRLESFLDIIAFRKGGLT
jgi:predicted nucleotide-binding protein (sugar kinase/HSP70/actin superfamily)